MSRLPLVLLLGLAACSQRQPTPNASPTAPTAAPKAPAPRVTGQGFVVEVTAPPAGVGAEVAARLTLKAVDGYKVNKEFPYSLSVNPPTGVEVVKAQQSVEDAIKFEDLEAAWDVKFTPQAAGDKKFAATFRFAVCTETSCDPKTAELAWDVAVK